MKHTLARQLLGLTLITLVVFACQPYATILLEYLVKFFHWLSYQFTLIFAHSYWADLIRLSLSVILLSVGFGFLVNTIYRLICKKNVSDPMYIVWIIWFLIIARII